MIGKQTRIACDSSAKKFMDHILHGPANEKIRIIRGGEFSIRSAFSDARNAKKTYAVRHIILSGKEDMNESDALELLGDYATEFGFNPDDVTLVEHTKPRLKGAGSERHYHIAVPELLPNGKVLSSSWMRPRNEKICRAFEVRHGLEVVKGKFNKAVINARPDLADALKSACDSDLPAESYSSKTHQEMLRKGKKMPSIKDEIANLWNDNIADFKSKLLENGYSIEQGTKKKYAFVIHDIDGSLVGSASRILKIKQSEFAIMYRNWENENVRTIQQDTTAEKEATFTNDHRPKARDSGQRKTYTSTPGTSTTSHLETVSGGSEASRRDYEDGSTRERGNSGNHRNTDEAKGRRRSASGDKESSGNDSDTTNSDDRIASKIATIRLRHLTVPRIAPVRIISREEARDAWKLASKPHKTESEYSFLSGVYHNLNLVGFDKQFKTPEAASKYASKILTSLIVNKINMLLDRVILAFFGDVAPLDVRQTPPNVEHDVSNIYHQAHERLSLEATEKGLKSASFEEFLDLMSTVDPMAEIVRYYEQTPNVEHAPSNVRHHPSFG